MVCSILRDEASFRVLRNRQPRNISHYLQLLDSFQYPKCLLSLALLVSDEAMLNSTAGAVTNAVRKAWLTHATLIYRPVVTGTEGARDRQAPALQAVRRRALAAARNFALLTALRGEQGVLWMDADITEVPAALLADMAASGRDIVVPAVRDYAGWLYDQNTWRGPATYRPNCSEQEQLAATADKPAGLPEPLLSKFLKRWTQGTGSYNADALRMAAGPNDTFVEIDSVGGGVLYVRSDVHRDGALFTTVSVIGADWDHDGYDGIESEGLCYLAQGLGYKCWLMPHASVVHGH